ncbi:MAG: hypothetical protein NTX25_02510 [Proteobacteria bacterium]|nr:hypothetical protein [Pseudomonadota bacterium]
MKKLAALSLSLLFFACGSNKNKKADSVQIDPSNKTETKVVEKEKTETDSKPQEGDTVPAVKVTSSSTSLYELSVEESQSPRNAGLIATLTVKVVKYLNASASTPAVLSAKCGATELTASKIILLKTSAISAYTFGLVLDKSLVCEKPISFEFQASGQTLEIGSFSLGQVSVQNGISMLTEMK